MEHGIGANEFMISILILKQTRNITRNNCDSITWTKPDFAKCPIVKRVTKLRFLSWRVGRNNNARRRWNDRENEPSPVPKNSFSCPQCTLDRYHYHEWRCRRTSFYLPTRPVRFCVCARARVCGVRWSKKKKRGVSHLYRLVLHCSEVYLAVDWHENPVEAFIMDGAVGLERGKKMSIHPAA